MAGIDNRRVAVFFPGALGDFICLLPALHALAERAHLEIFAKTQFADIMPENIKVGALERYEINRLFVAGAAFEQRVRDFFSSYERVYSWMGSSQPVFSSEIRAVAPERVRLFAFRGVDPAIHQSDYYLSCLELSGNQLPAVHIALQPVALNWLGEFCRLHALKEKALLVMAPGSGAGEKNWPAAYFATVGRWWRERTGGAVIILLGPVEKERGGFDMLTGEFIAAQDLSLAQVAALLARSDLYCGNDSGITHLCAALGATTMAVFGPSDPRIWAPRGPKVTLLRLGVACSPCDMNVMKICPHHQCLNDFSPLKVIEELEDRTNP
jgi:ADP-heptose:LPS heptosyltransferase